MQNITNRIIKSFNRIADSWEKYHEEAWGTNSEEPDKEMLKCGKNDAKDFRSIAKLIENNQLRKAANKAFDLDTIVREQIPNYAYNYLYKVSEDAENEKVKK